ncbi:MAG: hypothetical protein ACP5SH_26810 [Syntrophobacteraceae bacterium]
MELGEIMDKKELRKLVNSIDTCFGRGIVISAIELNATARNSIDEHLRLLREQLNGNMDENAVKEIVHAMSAALWEPLNHAVENWLEQEGRLRQLRQTTEALLKMLLLESLSR